MRTTALTLILMTFGSLVACGGGDQPAPKPPETPVLDAAAPEPVATTPVTPDVDASAPSQPPTTALPPPAGPAIKETIGTVTKIEVTAGGKKKFEITKAADVESLLKAIGTDQVPSGPLRRCPDDLVIVMKDATGAEKGDVGICKAESLGPEFWAPKGDRKAIALADEAAVKKALKIEDKPAAKPAAAPAKPAAKPAPKK